MSIRCMLRVLRLSIPCMALLLGACTTMTTGAPGQVARDWSCKLREMQILPIFPPREDVQVGDVYWLDQLGDNNADGYCKQAKDFLQLAPYVAYMDVRGKVRSHYTSRPDFPKTTTDRGTVTLTATGITIASAPVSTDATEKSDGLFTKGTANRMRVTAFPDFMTVHVDKTSLGAVLPIQSVLASIGIGAENLQDATISIPVAESYSVPASVFASTLSHKDGAVQETCNAAKFLTPSLQDRKGYFHVINEVFYTRAIDVTISGQSALTASASANLPAVSSTPAGITSTGIVTTSTVNGSVVQTITAVSDGMMKQFASRGNLPGVSVAYEQGNARTVSMRRVFDRPVAIGFRSIPIVIYDDCSIETPPAGESASTEPGPATPALESHAVATGLLGGAAGGHPGGSVVLALPMDMQPHGVQGLLADAAAAPAASPASGTGTASRASPPASALLFPNTGASAPKRHALGGQSGGHPWGPTGPARVAGDK